MNTMPHKSNILKHSTVLFVNAHESLDGVKWCMKWGEERGICCVADGFAVAVPAASRSKSTSLSILTL